MLASRCRRFASPKPATVAELSLVTISGVLQVAGRNGLPGHDQERIARHQRNRRKVLDEVVSQGEHGAVQNVGGPISENDRVAIRRCAGYASDPDCARCSGNVFDNDRLTKELAHALGHDPSDGVAGTARAERNDHCDRAARIGLSSRDANRRQGEDQSGCHMLGRLAPGHPGRFCPERHCEPAPSRRDAESQLIAGRHPVL